MPPKIRLRSPTLSKLAAATRRASFCSQCTQVRASQTVRVKPTKASWLPERHFSTSPTCLKKTGKANRAQAKTDSSPPSDGVAKPTAVDNAYDFSELETDILKSMEQLAHELSQLRAGGRFNPDKIEGLKVELMEESGKHTERLRDLAQVIGKGRNIQILVHDEGHIKPIKSAILSSNLSLNPQGPTSDAPTTLSIQVPPPTGESRLRAVETANQESQAALGRIREARGKHQKRLRAMGIAKTVRPDDLQKAQQQMEDVVKRGNEDIKRVVEDAKRVLNRS